MLWVRFPHPDVTFERAVSNTEVLIGAAAQAGVRRIVHASIYPLVACCEARGITSPASSPREWRQPCASGCR